MNKIFLIIIIGFTLITCVSRPKGFTNQFNGKRTELDKLIDINGYYCVQRNCDVANEYVIFMFYNNGIFISMFTNEKANNNIISCFEGISSANGCLTASLWGVYEIHNDTIVAQAYQDDGNWGHRFVHFTNFIVKSNTELICLDNYCTDKNVLMCKGKSKYPCPKITEFYPLEIKRDWRECPWLKKKWFTEIPK
ncbi:hypothetical protein JGH11_18505 [Dysgonomonas sp. Marseille-P4677]|uniref:hypothetical protein n=1 Tax=Dysgonomonas sp. Marseille-P4677 TaxID=2364790 RepID=UPI001913B314|nr:hypothetical protein [Dysgonomonas sp. Marseille-P4677]MBK5722866.1 hypothetical protein [Dysgonomonas sp. Marseille-P4677]